MVGEWGWMVISNSVIFRKRWVSDGVGTRKWTKHNRYSMQGWKLRCESDGKLVGPQVNKYHYFHMMHFCQKSVFNIASAILLLCIVLSLQMYSISSIFVLSLLVKLYSAYQEKSEFCALATVLQNEVPEVKWVIVQSVTPSLKKKILEMQFTHPKSYKYPLHWLGF